MKDEREILTRQTVLKKLVYEAKRSMIGSLSTCILGAIVLGMMSLLLLSSSSASQGIKLIVGLINALFYITCAFFFVRALLTLIKAKRGDFTIVEDVLKEIKDNQLSIMQLLIYGGSHTLFGNRSHLNHIFQFESGKMFIANVEEYKNTRLGAAAEFSLPGDSFFTVFFNDSPNKIILLFSSKTYIYKDEQ